MNQRGGTAPPKERPTMERQQGEGQRAERLLLPLLLLGWLAAQVAAALGRAAGGPSGPPLRALLLGGAIVAGPALLSRLRPGAPLTRHAVGAALALLGGLLGQLAGAGAAGLLLVGAALCALLAYRDPAVIATAAAAAAAQLLLRGAPASPQALGWLAFVAGVAMLGAHAGARADREAALRAAREGELAEAERRLDAAERLRDELLADLSHEVRGSLGAMLGSAELLLDARLGAADRRGYVQTIRRGSARLTELLDDLVDLSRLQAGEQRPARVRCSPSDLLAEVAALGRARARERRLAFDLTVEGPLPETVLSDPQRLRRALGHLVEDALQRTARGAVRLRARCEPRGPEAQLCFEISHEGGLAIEPPVRTSGDAGAPGPWGVAGLGLPLAERLIALLGGTLVAEGVPGARGGQLTARLPTGPLDGVRLLEGPQGDSQGAPQGAPQQAGPAPRLRPGGRVLVVDDGADNRLLIATHLRKAGLSVATAEDGQEGVGKALLALAAGEPFDLIFMDMQMPTLDGYAAAARLRAHGYERPIVALTARALPGDREHCLQAGCDDYLAKPATRVRLLEVVARHVRVSDDADAAAAAPESAPAEHGAAPAAVERFVVSLPSRAASLLDASCRDDQEALRRLSRGLRAAAAAYGFDAIGDIAAQIERASRSGASGELKERVADLLLLCNRTSLGHHRSPPDLSSAPAGLS